MRVAIFLPNWIGDVAMSTPALRAIRQHYGSTDRLIAVARPYVEPVLQGSRYFDEWMIYESHRRGKRKLVTRLRQADIDIIAVRSHVKAASIRSDKADKGRGLSARLLQSPAHARAPIPVLNVGLFGLFLFEVVFYG